MTINKATTLFVILQFLNFDAFAQAAKSVDDFKAEAAAAVSAISVDEAKKLVDDDAVVFVDVREADELTRLGKIPGAVHVPRGVLEFHIDPNSGIHNDVFSSGKTIVFYCASGGRSLLATKVAFDMGIDAPVYVDGGFRAWVAANGAIEDD